MPHRRRGARAIEAEPARGLAMRILFQSPKDTIAGAVAFAVMTAIIANALFLQAGRHPSPMFGSTVAMPAALAIANPLPRPRPAEADTAQIEPKLADPKPAEPKVAEPKPDAKSADPLANLVKATSAAPMVPSNIARPPAPIPVSSRSETITTPSVSRRVAAVQRALTEYGYGQLKPTGAVGTDTQAAIQKFERERKIPVTGQMSDRLVRELTAMIGHSID
jgi:hypothetical protein